MAIVALSDKWPRGSKRYDENYKCVVFEDKSEGSVKFKIGYKVDTDLEVLDNKIYVYVEDDIISTQTYKDRTKIYGNIYMIILSNETRIMGYDKDNKYYKVYGLETKNVKIPPFDINEVVSYWDNHTKKVIECKILKSECKITNVKIQDNKYYSFTINNKEYVFGNEDDAIRDQFAGFIITDLTPDIAKILTHPIPESLKLNSEKFNVDQFNKDTFYTYYDIEVGKWVIGKMYIYNSKYYIFSGKAKEEKIKNNKSQIIDGAYINIGTQLYYVIDGEQNIFKKLTKIYEETVWCCKFRINMMIHFLDKKDASVRNLTIGNIEIKDNFYIFTYEDSLLFTSDPKTMICDNQDNVPDKIYKKIDGFLLTNATNVSEWSKQKKILIVSQKFDEIHKEVDEILQIKKIHSDIIIPIETITQNLKKNEDEYISMYSKLNIVDIQLDDYHKSLKKLCDYLDKNNYVEKIIDLNKMESTVDKIIGDSRCDSDSNSVPNCDKIKELYKRKQQIVDNIIQHNKQKDTFNAILNKYIDSEKKMNLKEMEEIKQNIEVLLQRIQFQKVFIEYIKKQLELYNNNRFINKYIKIPKFIEIPDLPQNLTLDQLSFMYTIDQIEIKINEKLRKVENNPEILPDLPPSTSSTLLTPEQIKNNNEFINHVYQMLKHKNLKYLYYANKYNIPIEPSVITQFDNLTLIFSGGNYYELYKKNKLAYNNIYYNMYVTNKKKYEIISHL
jgi:hypothetical protein